MLTPDSPVSALYGVSKAREKLLEKLEIFTVDDLVRHYPRGYENRGEIKNACDLVPGNVAACILEITSPLKSARIAAKSGRAMTVQKVTAHDGTGSVAITFFNRDFLKNSMTVGRKFRFYGAVTGTLLAPQMLSPAFEPYVDGTPLDDRVPVYPLTAGITGSMLQRLMKEALPIYDGVESLSDEILRRYGLCGLSEALKAIHFPADDEALRSARKRLAFEELLTFQMRLRTLRDRNRTGRAVRFFRPDLSPFFDSLDFSLTGAQRRAVEHIVYDMTRQQTPEQVPTERASPEKRQYTEPMRRLLQGDVGSGKTIVAAAAVYVCVKSGCQAALMVPTEILAEQHYASLLPLMEKHRIVTALLTGSTPAKEKRALLAALREGKIDFLIGTHALIEENVVFRACGLAITDEQHRFGVRQREKLSSKASAGAVLPADGERADAAEPGTAVVPHMLVMSATPIPRTLALILYGDLDLSIIDELPPGRQKVDTFAVGESMRTRVYRFIEKQTAAGRQCYIVCPLAADSEETAPEELYDSELKSAQAHCETLRREVFPRLRIEFIHGKMKPAEKEKIMRAFYDGKTDILVSTTVIEVGVNVPNAALMVIENAERFGLSQLHQLRGRVGRGPYKSYCILMSPVIRGQRADGRLPSEKRFQIMCEHDSGFEIAEYDLKLRGPGDFFGRRQHGELAFKIADLAADMKLMEETKALADELSRSRAANKEAGNASLK